MKQTKKLEKISTHRTDIQLHANAYYKMYNFESANGKLFFFLARCWFFSALFSRTAISFYELKTELPFPFSNKHFIWYSELRRRKQRFNVETTTKHRQRAFFLACCELWGLNQTMISRRNGFLNRILLAQIERIYATSRLSYKLHTALIRQKIRNPWRQRSNALAYLMIKIYGLPTKGKQIVNAHTHMLGLFRCCCCVFFCFLFLERRPQLWKSFEKTHTWWKWRKKID